MTRTAHASYNMMSDFTAEQASESDWKRYAEVGRLQGSAFWLVVSSVGSAVINLIMGGTFREKFVGHNGSLNGCSAMFKYRDKNLNTKMSTDVTVLHC